MEYKIIQTNDEFEALKVEWERIESQSGVTFHSIFKYNFLWWNVFEESGQMQLFIVAIYNNNHVVGIAPLRIENERRRLYRCNVLKFLSPGDYSDFLVDIESGIDSKKIVAKIFDAIYDNKNKYDEIWLTHISQHTLLVYYLFISKYNRNLQYLIENPYIDFSKYESYANYTKEFLPKKIKQYLNRLQREVEFKLIVTNENVIDRISKIHIAEKNYLHSKGKSHRHSAFEDEIQINFMKDLYEYNDNIVTYLLVDSKSEDEIICFYWGFIHNNVFHSGITAYNPNYEKLAVGKIFNYMIFDENMKNPRWNIFDMGTGRYSWKFEMTNTFNFLYQYRDFVPSKKYIYTLNKFDKLITAISQFIRK